MDALNIEVGTKGHVSYSGENCNKFTIPATVIAIYEDYFGNKRFAILTDYGNCQSVNADFDKFGLVQFKGIVLFRFEVAK